MRAVCKLLPALAIALFVSTFFSLPVYALVGGKRLTAEEQTKLASVVFLQINLGGGFVAVGWGVHIGEGRLLTTAHTAEKAKAGLVIAYNLRGREIDYSTENRAFIPPARTDAESLELKKHYEIRTPDIAILELPKLKAKLERLPVMPLYKGPVEVGQRLYAIGKAFYGSRMNELMDTINAEVRIGQVRIESTTGAKGYRVAWNPLKRRILGNARMMNGDCGAPLLVQNKAGEFSMAGTFFAGQEIPTLPLVGPRFGRGYYTRIADEDVLRWLETVAPNHRTARVALPSPSHCEKLLAHLPL